MLQSVRYTDKQPDATKGTDRSKSSFSKRSPTRGRFAMDHDTLLAIKDP